jgi:hypothetical protein
VLVYRVGLSIGAGVSCVEVVLLPLVLLILACNLPFVYFPDAPFGASFDL